MGKSIGTIEDRPISVWLEEARKDSYDGNCYDKILLFAAKRMGLKLKNREKEYLEICGEARVKNYMLAECYRDGITLEERIRELGWEEIEWGRLPRMPRIEAGPDIKSGRFSLGTVKTRKA